LNNEKICCEISDDKIEFYEKTAGLWSGNFSNLNSACSFEDMLKGQWQRKILLAISILLDNLERLGKQGMAQFTIQVIDHKILH
jgi:hypothetical protein